MFNFNCDQPIKKNQGRWADNFAQAVGNVRKNKKDKLNYEEFITHQRKNNN